MCARFILTSAPQALRRLFKYPETPNFPARPEIFPTEPMAIVTGGFGGERHFLLVRWGFLPVWAKGAREIKPLINARIETALDKPSFKGAMHQGRCLIPADGFYEWSAAGRRGKLRHTITPVDGGPIAFAGLWGTWGALDGSEIDGAAILTMASHGPMAGLHERSPVTIRPAAYDAWLDSAVPPLKALAALRQAGQIDLTITPPPPPPAISEPRQSDLFA